MNEPNIAPPRAASKPAQTLAEQIASAQARRERVLLEDGGYRPLRFPLQTMRDTRAPLTDRYLVKNWVPSDSLVLVGGVPKCGKTFLVADMVGHIALGMDWRGFRVRQGNVLYVAAEGATGFEGRMAAWRDRYVAEDGDPPFVLLKSRFDLVRDVESFIEDVEWQTGDMVAPHVVVLDTVARTFTGDENSAQDMGNYVKACDVLRERLSCTVIGVHHFGHGQDRLRGSSALAGGVDVMISVKKDDATKVITAAVDFGKDVPDGTSTASKMEVVEIGEDEDGEQITTCLLVPTDDVPAEKRGKSKLSAPQQIALIALKQVSGDHGEVPPASNHIPPNVRTVGYALWRETAYKRGISDGDQHAKNAAFNRAAKRLLADGVVGCWNDQVWPIEARS